MKSLLVYLCCLRFILLINYYMFAWVLVIFTSEWHEWLVLEFNWQLGWRFLPQGRICVAFLQKSFKTRTKQSRDFKSCENWSISYSSLGCWIVETNLLWEHFLFYYLPFVYTRFWYFDPLTSEVCKNKNSKFPISQYVIGRVVFLLIYISGFPFLPWDWLDDFLQMSATI